MAAKIRHAMLSSMQEKLSTITDGEKTDALDLLTGDALRLMKDSEDRAHGTPKQSVEHSGDAENPMTLRLIERRIVRPRDDG